MKNKLKSLEIKTIDQTIKGYLKSTLSLSDEVLKIFLLHVKFELNEDEIIERVKNSILSKVIAAHRVDEVFEKLHSNLHKDNFLATKAGQSIVISFSDFNSKYSKIFADVRTKKLVRHKFSFVPPPDLNGQTFIRQLLEIGDFKVEDSDSIIRYTTEKLMLENHLTKKQVTVILGMRRVGKSTAVTYLLFTHAYRFADDMNDDKKRTNALEMIDELRRSALSVDLNPLENRLSNGVFYYLSDLPTIGWDQKWDKKFK